MNNYLSKKFLIVDDMDLVRKTLRDGLYKLGFKNVIITDNGQEALNILDSQPIDCILSDWNMPGMSGLELLRLVRSTDKFKKIRFMLVTGLVDRNSVNSAIVEGVDQFLVKPFNLASLEKKVRIMLSRPANTPMNDITNGDSALELSENTDRGPNSPAPEMNKKNGLILVVDDISSNIDILVGLLHDDYKIKAARSGAAALKICQSDTPPDLILLDVMMPEMDGFEVCRRLKADPNTQHIPIIFITAKTETVDITQGFALGAVDYVTKPPQPEVLKARVYTHINLKHSRDELLDRIDTVLDNARLREEIEHMTRHDLKNPLSALIGIADELIDDRWLAIEQRMKVEDMRTETYRVLSMINSSLDLYKMEMGTYKLQAHPYNIVDTLLGVVKEGRAYGLKNHIKVLCNTPDNITVNGEESLCFTMLSNLLRNAIEASGTDKIVYTELKEVDGHAIIQIHNDSVVPEEIRDSLFEKHVTHGKRGGTGLGAYSAQLMAHIQKGEIDFVSSEKNGTIFKVTLPLEHLS
ncbi:response regulator [Shewanella sp.]|uniref:ATP-binding response regulator n=1 Tax=Shewanella sp. TaxID=50422 RepID=UPI003A85BA38